jgi:hypothetical protein
MLLRETMDTLTGVVDRLQDVLAALTRRARRRTRRK